MVDEKEVENQPIEQPELNEEVDNQIENNPEPQNEVVKPVAESEPERLSSKHFKRVVEEKEKLQRERDELLRLMQDDRNRHTPQQPEPEDDFGIDVNNFVEGKDLKRYAQEVRQLKKDLQAYKQKTQMEVTETRLRSEFADFEKVFSKENMKILEMENPELVETIATSSADPYKVAKSMYKAIKQFGVYSEDTFEPDRERVQKNLAKPKAVVSATNRQTGNSPLNKISEYAEDLTEERKAALRAEVNKYKR